MFVLNRNRYKQGAIERERKRNRGERICILSDPLKYIHLFITDKTFSIFSKGIA